MSRCSQSWDSASRAYYSGSDVMSRYSTRSLDVGSTRYDSGSTYKSFDPSSMGSYRSSNLTGYGSTSHGHSARSDRLGSYSSNGAASGLASSRVHGSYTPRSAAADSMPLPLPRSSRWVTGCRSACCLLSSLKDSVSFYVVGGGGDGFWYRHQQKLTVLSRAREHRFPAFGKRSVLHPVVSD